MTILHSQKCLNYSYISKPYNMYSDDVNYCNVSFIRKYTSLSLVSLNEQGHTVI